MGADFVHLNVHSYYSFGQGVNSPESLIRLAHERGMRSMALTDTNNLCGAAFFQKAAREGGIRPIIGAEVLSDNRRGILLARNLDGYRCISRAITALHLDKDFSLEKSLANSDGVILLTDELPLLKALKGKKAPDELYVELRPGRPRRPLLKFSSAHRIPPVAANNVHFSNVSGHSLHKMLRSIHRNTTLSALKPGDFVPKECWLRSSKDMERLFPECPEAVANTIRIAGMCTFEIPLGRRVFPRYPGKEELRGLVFKGARERYGLLSPVVKRRIERELKVVYAKGYADYLLVLWDIVRNFPITCGRGSAANSIVSYCLYITHVEPLKNNLGFERFLNPERDDPPDIDVDFPWDERDRVIDYVRRRYGEERTAMVCNHVTLKSRAALREVARVYGLPEAEIKSVTEKIPYFFHSRGLKGLIGDHPHFRGMAFRPPWPEIIEVANNLHGVPRHLSVHCGGMIIVPGRIDDYVPVQRAPNGVRIVQWDKEGCEDAGLIKIDLLGNRSLAVIRDCLSMVRENTGRYLDYTRLDPDEDEAVKDLFRRGDTMGVFYTESPPSRLLARKSGSGDFEGLVINTSIIRPAANRFINEYLSRLMGRPYKPLHPLLEDVLAETYGIMVFQEDVTRVCRALGGMGLKDADGLRKSLSKKRNGLELKTYREKFLEGALKRGVDKATVGRIWEMILSFSGYSFCKGHSASYILVAQKSCYLKAHYQAEFMAAVMSNQGGYYTTGAYVSEARRMGLRVLPVDVNLSRYHTYGRDPDLRLGLLHIKGLTEGAIRRVLGERERGGRYQSFEEFLERSGIGDEDARVLIRAGAVKSIADGLSRPQLMWRVEMRRNRSPAPQRELPIGGRGSPPVPALREYPQRIRLRQEYESLGFLASCHPMSLFKKECSKTRHIKARDIDGRVGEEATFIGMLITRKEVIASGGEPMSFVTFEDSTGLIETVIFPAVFKRVGQLLFSQGPFIIKGRIQEEFGAATVEVKGLKRLTKIRHIPTDKY